MESLIDILISLLLGGLGIAIVAKLLPGFHVRGGFGSAMLVAAIYGLLKAGLQGVLVFLSFPLMLISLGLFIVVINAALLWATDKLMKRFEVDSLGQLLLGSLLLSAIDFGYQLILSRGSVL